MAEIHKIFGPESSEKFLTIFAGTTIRVPSTKDLEEEEINLAIHETLKNAKSPAESRRLAKILCARFGIKRKDLRRGFQKTKKKLKDATAFVIADRRTSQHLSRKRRK